MDPATLAIVLPLIAKVGGSAIDAAFAPSPYQPRQTFSNNGGGDLRSSLGSIQATLGSVLSGALEKVGDGPSLPDAHVGTLPSFSGGGLPMPIGVTSAKDSGHGDLLTGYGTSNVLNPTVPTVEGNVPPGSTPGNTRSLPTPPGINVPLGNADPTFPGGSESTWGSASSALSSGKDGIRGSQLLDPQTQGALQLLYHAAMQQQQQPGASSFMGAS